MTVPALRFYTGRVSVEETVWAAPAVPGPAAVDAVRVRRSRPVRLRAYYTTDIRYSWRSVGLK